MSTVIRSCPGCKSLILSDTDQCPECGHVFYERRKTESSGVAPNTPDTLKSASIQDPCPHCGELVRTGLVRCWSCNGFMRADVAARYRDLTTKPQPIIYSTISPEQRTDFLPPRAELSDFANRQIADTDGFQLGNGINSGTVPESSGSGSDFDLDGGFAVNSGTPPASEKPSSPEKTKRPARQEATKPASDGPDKPQTTTNVTSSVIAPERAPEPAAAEPEKPAEKSARKSSAGGGNRPARGGDDDLFSIAVEEQKEVKKRRGQKTADRLRKQIMVPCSCGAWIRVNEDQAGKNVRCKQCKQGVLVPGIRKKPEKTEKSAEKKGSQPKLNISWVDDAWYHVLSPAALVLKPGSLTGKHIEVDLAVTDAGLQVLTFSGTAKKRSLFSFVSSNKKADHQLRRKQIHDQVGTSGDFKNLENVEVRTIVADRMSELRLVQPVAKVSESMFAGVPVFGEGRIAVFLPVDLEEGKQAYLSFTLSNWRTFNQQLKTRFGTELPSTENGIPETDKTETLSCFLNQSKIDAVKGLIFYQQDAAYQLELTGYKCKSCGTAVSEEGRKKAKLGGVKGRSIAKAKCPKCAAKMQAEAIYKVAKGPAPIPEVG